MASRCLSTFESDLPRLVRDLEALVNLESPSEDAPRVSRPDEEVGSAASRELTLSVARRHRRVVRAALVAALASEG
jgi:hypothetical protein